MTTVSGTFVGIQVNTITAANPAVATTNASHGFSVNDTILFDQLDDMTELDGVVANVSAQDGSTGLTFAGLNTSNFTAESGTSGRVMDNPASAVLSLREIGEVVEVTLTGSWTAKVYLERETTPGSGAWEKVLGPWLTNPGVVPSYVTTQQNETLRLRVTRYTTGTITYSFADTEKISQIIKDAAGRELARFDQDGMTIAGTLTVDGAVAVTGQLTAADDVVVDGSDVDPVDVQTFNGSGTWTKPTGGITKIKIQAWGSGASGGVPTAVGGGGGGGGGAYVERTIDAADASATETVTVGAAGVSVTVADTDGNAGADVTFGSLLTAFGGGGGAANGVAAGAGGGGGGGSSVGVTPTGIDTGTGGEPAGSAGGATGAVGVANAGAGGAGGGGGHATTPGNGGEGFNGGGGGGGGSLATAGGVGGLSTNGGGGGGGGADDNAAGGAGGAATNGGGAGGAGGGGTTAGTAGTAPGGGGGGGGGDGTPSASGAGGIGRIIVTSW